MNNTNAEGMKVWQVSDTDWVAALTGEAAIAEFKNMIGPNEEIDEEYPIEMGAEWLDRPVQEFDEDEQPIKGKLTTARRYLDEIVGTEAGWFWGFE